MQYNIQCQNRAISMRYIVHRRPFGVFALWRPNRWRRALKELSNALSCGAVGLLIPELWADLYKNVEKGQNLIFGDFWWPDVWPDLRNDRGSFIMIFDAFSNTTYHVSLHGPEAELEGGVQTPPARRVRRRAPARRGLTRPTKADDQLRLSSF